MQVKDDNLKNLGIGKSYQLSITPGIYKPQPSLRWSLTYERTVAVRFQVTYCPTCCTEHSAVHGSSSQVDSAPPTNNNTI